MLRQLSSPVRIFSACFHGGTKSWERDLCCESETECCPIKKALDLSTHFLDDKKKDECGSKRTSIKFKADNYN